MADKPSSMRARLGRDLLDLFASIGTVEVTLDELYRAAEERYGRELDRRPDAARPTEEKWRHDLRWELQTAVSSGRIIKRPDRGRGVYQTVEPLAFEDTPTTNDNSGGGGERAGVSKTTVPRSIHWANPEKISPDPVLVYTAEAVATWQRVEAHLVNDWITWCFEQKRTVVRPVIVTDEGETVRADGFDETIRLLVEAKRNLSRPVRHLSMRI